jgi:2-polyprenyl-6-methoxyphenol hydroxylase-like FAD-dependent oxidoreductase
MQSVLAAHLPPGLLHQQAVFDRYEEADEGVTIHFQGGRPPVTARLLVGCDGGQSAVRKQCIGDGPPVFAGT